MAVALERSAQSFEVALFPIPFVRLICNEELKHQLSIRSREWERRLELLPTKLGERREERERARRKEGEKERAHALNLKAPSPLSPSPCCLPRLVFCVTLHIFPREGGNFKRAFCTLKRERGRAREGVRKSERVLWRRGLGEAKLSKQLRLPPPRGHHGGGRQHRQI